MANKQAWLTTRSGIQFFLNSPSESMIHWDDIAESLAKTCRFNGHCRGFYSVAQHSMIVANAMPIESRIYGLLHDAHEAYTGDIISPVKNCIGTVRQSRLDSMQNNIDRQIYSAAKIPPPNEDLKQRIHIADIRALATEWRDIVVSKHDGRPFFKDDEDLRPFDGHIKPLPNWETAKAAFLQDLAQELQHRGIDITA